MKNTVADTKHWRTVQELETLNPDRKVRLSFWLPLDINHVTIGSLNCCKGIPRAACLLDSMHAYEDTKVC